MNLLDIAKAKAMFGSSGGGGGSSDFTKAVVTITDSQLHPNNIKMMPTTLEDVDKILGFVWGVSGVTIPTTDIDFSTGTYTCYIKSGEYICFYNPHVTEVTSYTVTGNAEVVSGGVDAPAIVKVTGDCSINLA